MENITHSLRKIMIKGLNKLNKIRRTDKKECKTKFKNKTTSKKFKNLNKKD